MCCLQQCYEVNIIMTLILQEETKASQGNDFPQTVTTKRPGFDIRGQLQGWICNTETN